MVVVANEPIEESEPMMKAEEYCDVLSNKVRRTSCADEAYKNITGSMKADPLLIRSPKTAIELLSTGARLQNMPLVKQCIEILDRQLDKTNVLIIYTYLSKCKLPTGNKNEFEPSAPPIIENQDQHNTDWLEELTNNLRHNCLLMIDKHADYVFKQKEILDLSYADLVSITERDSLQVSDEMLIYSVVYRWAIEECKRRKLNIHLLNMKAVLRDLNYTPRYGLMSKTKFMLKMVDNIKGPTRSEILEEKEWRLIKFYIEEKSKKRPVDELPHKWSRPRIIGNQKPYFLSSRSSSPHAVNTNSTTLRANCQTKTTCENCLLHFLTCWTAIFD